MQGNRTRPRFWSPYSQPFTFKVPEQTNRCMPPFQNGGWSAIRPAYRFSVNAWHPFGHFPAHNPQSSNILPIRPQPPRNILHPFFRQERNLIPPGNRVFVARTSRFRLKKRRRIFKSNRQPTLNPSDPLNLLGLMSEEDRRRIEGLSPLHGDSRYNTPSVGANTETNGASPAGGAAVNTRSVSDNAGNRLCAQRRRGNQINYSRWNRRQANRLPLTGNYTDYYCRRNPTDRICILLPEWFTGCDIADYGCHNGTLTFSILEKFPDINKIDAFDCDPELVANARNMQREKIRWRSQIPVRYDKINFQTADWSESHSTDDEPTYDTILAFSVTKWIHLNYGDAGLMRFFRRIFNLLRPGGRLLLEPQPKTSYRKTRFTKQQQENYQNLAIDPSNLQPLLLDIGFSYFDTIKTPHPREAFQRRIILCSKSYGATPASIRNNFREEAHDWGNSSALYDDTPAGPPPVRYNPMTPHSLSISSSPYPLLNTDPSTEHPQFEVISSTVVTPPDSSRNGGIPGEATPLGSLLGDQEAVSSVLNLPNAPDSTSGNP